MGEKPDILVAKGERLVLSIKNPKCASMIAAKKVSSLEELKKKIGIPDEVAQKMSDRDMTLPTSVMTALAQPSALPNVYLKAMTKAYLLGKSSDFQTMSKAWRDYISRIRINELQVNNITVENDGALVIARNIDLLTANDVMIMKGGRLVIEGTQLTINCKSVKGEASQPSLPTLPPIVRVDRLFNIDRYKIIKGSNSHE